MNLRPEILSQPNIPKPLHGLSPRVINGDAWWAQIRKEVYARYEYHCIACGVHKTEAKGPKWLEAHECYDFDYVKGIATVKSIEPLCHYCHNFIHSGRLEAIMGKEKSVEEVKRILEYGFFILAGYNLKCFWGTLELAKKVSANTYKVKLYFFPEIVAPWEKWRLVFNGKEYFSLYKNKEEHNKHYSKEGMMERPKTAALSVGSAYTGIIQSEGNSKPVLIIGKSGSGKSSSIRTLPAKNTFLINVIGKDLPFRGWRKSYKINDNMLCSDSYTEIENELDKIKKRKEIKFIIIDDFQYLMANEFMNRAYEKGYDKWTEIGKHAFDLLFKAKTLGSNRIVFFLAHSDTNDLGDTDVKTLGKMLSEKIVVAGMFTIVLQCFQDKGAYLFETKSATGKSVVKTPFEMFATDRIPNDLKMVADAIYKFEND
jgi:AAA domain